MSKRGRPRCFDRDAALAAAMELFWRKGYTATSMADLCVTMGIGSPSLYAAFGSKEQLYAEAIERYEAESGPVLWASLEGESTARAAFEDFLMASAASLSAPGTPAGCMLTLSTVREEGHERLGEIVAASRASGLARLEERLVRATLDGELPMETNCKAVARFYLSVQQGMSIQARDGAGRVELEEVARAAMAAWPSSTSPGA